MAKITTLRNKGTGEVEYPRTYVKAVIDDLGNTIDTLIKNEQEVCAKILENQGDLRNLKTANKITLVDAINEAALTGGSGGSGGISGFKYIDSIESLPAYPIDEEKTLGYIIGISLYLYVETGGDTLGGKYMNIGEIKGPKGDAFLYTDFTKEQLDSLKGPKGDPGEKGPQGPKGESTIIDTSLSDTSLNTVQNKVITLELNNLKETIESLKTQINNIILGNTKVTLTVSPNLIFNREQTSVTITANIIGNKGNIEIIRSGQVIARSENNESTTLSFTENINTSTIYTSRVVIGNKEINNTAKVSVTDPVYIGPGKIYTDIITETWKIKKPINNIQGEYQINITSPGQKAYFIIPDTMEINVNTVTMGGFLFPITLIGIKQVNSSNYKVYESSPIDEARKLIIKIS